MHLTLVDQAFLVRVDEFDWVFDRNHVLPALGVDLVQHRSQRGRFAAACRSGHQHQSSRFFAQFLDDRRKPQLLESHNIKRDHAKNRGCRSQLIEDIGAEAGDVLDTE